MVPMWWANAVVRFVTDWSVTRNLSMTLRKLPDEIRVAWEQDQAAK